MLSLKEKDGYLSVKRRIFYIWLASIVLVAGVAFAAGFLYHSQGDHAPIIIEQNVR